jgi:Uma2 family endonuclease
MNIEVQQSPELFQAQRLVVYGVNWQTYEKVLDAFADRPIRITYDRGNLELMSPLPIHEVYKCLFLRLIDDLSDALDFAMKACGSTTFRREDLDRGLEPDECFYLANLSRVRSWTRIDLTVDPPPDLAVEVDNTNSSLDRMGIYAALGVPELWRFDGETLQAHELVAGVYLPRPHSPTFPFLPLAEIVSLLDQSITITDDRELRRNIRSWVRDRVVPLHHARQQQQSPPPAANP